MSGTDNTREGIYGNTSSPINNSHELKIRDEFLKILRDNAFNGMDGGDVIDHIARVVEITEWIKIPDINKNHLRVYVFSKSLSNDAKKWTTRCGLWEFYVNERTKGAIGNLHDEPRDESSHMTYSGWFYKPHLDTHDGNEIYEIINNEGSPVLGPARHDICDQDELCKTEEFTVVRYSMGLDKEFVAVEPSKKSTVKRTTRSMSRIYLNLFDKRNHGSELKRRYLKIIDSDQYANDDIPPWGKNQQKEEGEGGPKWGVRKEYLEEEVAEIMAETMEQYMSKTQADYGSGVVRPKIEDNDNFELKGQFLKELRDNTFNGSYHEYTNEHIEKVLEIVDLFHIPSIIIDQVMLRAFPISLTGAASRWLRNKPSGSITTWEDLKIKFLSKYCPPARTILDSRGSIPSKTAADAKVAIQEMIEYSQKWHNGISRTRSTETSDGLAAI
ncbi:hypothetical protein Tco_1067759 [Tanacetum coccineum]|uniref:Retrotransposon gag domain-containing protein n=1 Tax=Tanacetum coccineum TaxID=301880 RepID=A0ABQ5HDT4_9ASTR